ncbi:hypothetical protein E2562_004499 [Oryza meyeriana var. granulata]|uniref:Uncharacterized protein n=1 Tax=Oryza meyeriana var. granulata TaxID=110450 RepID=A0A6G1F3E6_9ORYZ|nr:hypothetical protein E2562_004499 [Oryza meyeriana var. granulata]
MEFGRVRLLHVHAVRMRRHAQVELDRARALRDDAVRMRQKAQMDLGCARTLRVHSLRMRLQLIRGCNTDDSKADDGDEDGVHKTTVDARIRDGSVVDSLARADHFTDSDNIGYVIDSLANNIFVADSLEETDTEEKKWQN